ncbi:TIM-barrel domain-containing protein [Paenibacillus apii]|uniref:TIM-barrel domain-containing protein n=1 Tax=Paenibacillus apii TaxID=1850370 RepID=UPI00143C1C13|nr:TIM-barrel domain-containing protein [Paenibacillus apii]NJJ41136.1 DUF5110 domain-containing protein [Paenibacillus apii]
MQTKNRKRLHRLMASIMAFSLVVPAFGSGSALARNSEFTRNGSGPMYWISYEHQWTQNTYMPEDRWKANIDWMAENFQPYGYDMVSTDGWIEGATLLNENGYIVSHNNRWMTDPLGAGGETEPVYGVVNGNFNDEETKGWTFTGPAGHGRNDDNGNKSLWTYKEEPHQETVSQNVYLKDTGLYRLSARAKTKNGMFADGVPAYMKIKGYDAADLEAETVTAITYEDWTDYSALLNVTNPSVYLEFSYDSLSKNKFSAGLDLDDVKLEKETDEVDTSNHVVNGDFNQGNTDGWNITGTGGGGSGTNDDGPGDKSLYTWNPGADEVQTVSQSIHLPNGLYTVKAKAKTKNDMIKNGATAVFQVDGYNTEVPEAALAKTVSSESWTDYSMTVDVTSGKLDLAFVVDPKGKAGFAGIDLDDVEVKWAGPNDWQGYPSEVYPDGHTWKYWADYIHSKGMKLGIYYDPLWVSPEVLKHPDKYHVTVKNDDGSTEQIPVASLIKTEPYNLGNGKQLNGDRFDGGQGADQALYWLDVNKKGAKEYLQGYIRFLAEQGASFLRVDFLSWYESGYDQGLGQIGTGHDSDTEYAKALQWMDEASAENHMFLSLVMPDLKGHAKYEQQFGDMIRIDEDVFAGGWDHTSGRRQNWTASWSQWANSFQGFTGFSDISGRGSMINDGDFLRLNTYNGQFADNERKTALSLFTMAGSPITIADQYDTIRDNAKFYQNPELIELNKSGLVGKPIYYSGEHYKNNASRDSERWAGQLPDGTWAVALFNRSDESKALSMNFVKELGLNDGAYVRDIWEHKDLGYKTIFSKTLEPHDAVVLKLIPKTASKSYQAEVASYQGGAIFGNDAAGYQGFGYIAGLNQKGAKLTFAVSVPQDGNYPLNVRYANGNEADGSLAVTVEDIAGSPVDSDTVTFKSLGKSTWDKWSSAEKTISLKKGTNLITLAQTEDSAGSVHIDSISFSSGTGQLINGDFETGNETGWTVDTQGTTIWHGVDTNDAYAGHKQYLYSPDAGGKAVSQQRITSLKNGHYTLSAMVKLMPHTDPTFAGGKAKLVISQPGKDDVTVNITPSLKDGVPSTGKAKWDAGDFQYKEFKVEADITEQEATVKFILEAPKPDTSMQIDNVKFTSEESAAETLSVALYNPGFDEGFAGWSRTNMTHQAIARDGDNAFAQIGGASDYSSDIWQFGNAPADGVYQLTLKTRKTGELGKAQVYVTYSGGTKTLDIPAGAEFTELKLPNIQLAMNEVVKVGVISEGKAGSSLSIDDFLLQKDNDQQYKDVTFVNSLSETDPYQVSAGGRAVVLNSQGSAKVKLEFVKADTAKVWMEPTGTFAKKDTFVVDSEQGSVIPSVKDMGDEGYILIQTDALSIRAYKSPFRLAYYDASNTKLLSEQVGGAGFGYDGDTGVYNEMALAKDEHFFGLGMDRDAQSFDRLGKKVVMNNAMTGGYGGNTSDVSSTFFTSTKGYGLYFDNTYENVTFDMGAADAGKYSFSAPNGEMLYYFIAGDTGGSLNSIMKSFSSLTGTAPIPPMWALGYMQSRFGYRSWNEVDGIVDTFRSKDIPLDSMVLDVYWAKKNHYFDMTWNDDPAHDFSSPKANMAELQEKGVNIVTIVDPYIQVTASNFKEGDSKGYFVKDASGKTVIYPAWYGKAGLIDFTNPEAAKWYSSQVKKLHDAGVKGYWIDLNEPEQPTDSLRDQFAAGSAAEITNVYALNEAKAFYDGQRSYTGDRVWTLARSGFTGIQQYGTTVWSGDIDASWVSFSHQLQLGLSAAASGISYFTNDTGGFNGKPSPELYTRWMQAASLMPIFRSHVALGDNPSDPTNIREPWAFGANAEASVTKAINQRYQLLPYIYSTAKQTADGEASLMKPLVMDYANDSNVYNIQDQWMFGGSIMAAPVNKEGASQRTVYLPSGTWYDWNSEQKFNGGQEITYNADLNTVPMLVKEGAIIPTRAVQDFTEQTPASELTLKVYPLTSGETSSFTLYEDDGSTYDYEKGQSAATEIKASAQGDKVSLNIAAMNGSYTGKVESRVWASEVKIGAEDKDVYSVKRNGKELKEVGSKEAVQAGHDVWFYDAAAHKLYFRTAEAATSEAQQITAALTGKGAPSIKDVTLDAAMHRAGSVKDVQIAVHTANVTDGTAVKAVLLKNALSYAGVPAASGSIAGGTANLTLSLPATLPAGPYQIRVEAGNVSYTLDYTVLKRMEDSFKMEPSFNMNKLEAGKYLDAKVKVTNALSEDKQVLIIAALYDGNGGLKMVNHAYSSSLVKAGQTLQLNAGFQLPASVAGFKVKLMVWEGEDLMNTTMMPLADVVELTP